MVYSLLLRVVLLLGALGWGIAIFGLILPWPQARAALESLGLGPGLDDPMLDYWLRMGSGTMVFIAALFALALVRPATYANLLPLLAAFSLCEGTIHLVSGLLLRLPPYPFWLDTVFCYVVGLGIVVLAPLAARERAAAATARA